MFDLRSLIVDDDFAKEHASSIYLISGTFLVLSSQLTTENDLWLVPGILLVVAGLNAKFKNYTSLTLMIAGVASTLFGLIGAIDFWLTAVGLLFLTLCLVSIARKGNQDDQTE